MQAGPASCRARRRWLRRCTCAGTRRMHMPSWPSSNGEHARSTVCAHGVCPCSMCPCAQRPAWRPTAAGTAQSVRALCFFASSCGWCRMPCRLPRHVPRHVPVPVPALRHVHVHVPLKGPRLLQRQRGAAGALRRRSQRSCRHPDTERMASRWGGQTGQAVGGPAPPPHCTPAALHHCRTASLPQAPSADTCMTAGV